MTIQITITNNGSQPGTVGWLAKTARNIQIAPTKGGGRGAWLRDAEGKDIALLAHTEYGGISRSVRMPDTYRTEAAETISWTDAGWEAFGQLQDVAVEELEKDSGTVTFTVAA
jgi:hypothetical protein